jgi:hypothetical protein
MNIDDITDPGRYASERLVKVSIDVIALSIALSRYVARCLRGHMNYISPDIKRATFDTVFKG